MKYFLKKLAILLVSFILISLAVFFVFQILPGDITLIILGPDADEYQIQRLTETLGLDLPAHIRYLQWLAGFFRADLGYSIRNSSISVYSLIATRLEVTLTLSLMVIIFSSILGFILGLLIGRYNDSWLGKCLSILSQVFVAIPTFWLGLMLSLFFGVILSILPTNGFNDGIRSLILPALSVSLGNAAVIARFLKNSILTQNSSDYVRTAKSRGLSENKVLIYHILRNVMLPSITIFGMIVADTVSGSIIIEQVFNLPGIGQLLINSISYRDLPVVQALCMYILVTVITINFIVEITYKLLDPRIRGQ